MNYREAGRSPHPGPYQAPNFAWADHTGTSGRASPPASCAPAAALATSLLVRLVVVGSSMPGSSSSALVRTRFGPPLLSAAPAWLTLAGFTGAVSLSEQARDSLSSRLDEHRAGVR